MEDGITSHCIYILTRPIQRVSFYDRASTPRQQHNGARLGYCEYAKAYAERMGWDLVPSYDARNGGICFLDCGSSTWSVDRDTRPELFNAFDGPADTIAAIAGDRLDRGGEVADQIEHLAWEYKKNLIVCRNRIEEEFEQSVRRLFRQAARDLLEESL